MQDLDFSFSSLDPALLATTHLGALRILTLRGLILRENILNAVLATGRLELLDISFSILGAVCAAAFSDLRHIAELRSSNVVFEGESADFGAFLR